MKILVTGAAGFIGFHLIKLLVKEEYEVVGLDNLNQYYSVELKQDRLKECGIFDEEVLYNQVIYSKNFTNYKFIKLDLEDEYNLNTLFNKEYFDIVINLAAQAGVRYSIEAPKCYIKSNIEGFLNILELCKRYNIKKLLYASSSSVYGLNENQPFSVKDKVDTPISIYAATKKTNELMAHTYSHLFGMITIGLRFFTVYGPYGRPDMAPFLFADAISAGKEVKVFNRGEMERDFTYVDDIVMGIKQTIEAFVEKNYTVLNIGNSKPINLLYFIECIERELDKNANKVFVEMQLGDVKKTWADISELEEITNYRPSTPIEVGVREFIKWYKEYYNI